MRRLQFLPDISTASLITVAASLLSISACVAPYTDNEIALVERALLTGNTSELRGRTDYLYQRRLRQLRVEQAARNLDPSGLDYLEIGLYREELAKIDRKALEAEIERERLAAQLEIERQRAAEEQRLADIAAKAEAELQAAREAARIEREREAERQRKIAAEEAYKKKIAAPIHPEWNEDIDRLAQHFKSNDFKPADRLANVYARTMQLVLNGSADTDKMSNFFAELSDPEQADYNRLFADQTGVQLVADFWSSHERAGLVQPPATN